MAVTRKSMHAAANRTSNPPRLNPFSVALAVPVHRLELNVRVVSQLPEVFILLDLTCSTSTLCSGMKVAERKELLVSGWRAPRSQLVPQSDQP